MLDAPPLTPAGVFDVFDEVGETLSAFADWFPGYTSWTQEIAQHADIDSLTRLVDVGCGTGRFLAALSRKEPGADLVGVEEDRDSVTLAKRRLASASGNIEIKRSNLERLPFEDDEFEVATLTFLLRTIPRAARMKILRETKRIVRPGGRILVADRSDRGCALARWTAAGVRLVPALPEVAGQEGTPTLDELQAAGFDGAERVSGTCDLGGGIEILRAYKPVIRIKRRRGPRAV
jgi:ubiquinone/menaquinone biosynthesis C-methylase UbiE